MNTHRLNITLPKNLALRLKAKGNKSAFIAEAVREKLDAEEKRRQQEELARAYRESARRDRRLLEDWDILAGDAL